MAGKDIEKVHYFYSVELLLNHGFYSVTESVDGCVSFTRKKDDFDYSEILEVVKEDLEKFSIFEFTIKKILTINRLT